MVTTIDGVDYPKFWMLSVRLFQLSNGTPGIGIHSKNRGRVWRWDRGFRHRPTVIHWLAPHCADDQCGSPCAHGDG